jgi:hypothetical protein
MGDQLRTTTRLDLETGEVIAAEGSPPVRRRRPRLASRLDRMFERLATSLEAREEFELAGVIREERKAMSGGLVLLTQHFDVLRDPLLRLLGFVEPVVAFGRVGRIIARRIVERRARSAEDDEVDDRAGDGGSSR